MSAPTHNAAAGDDVLPDNMLTISDGIERSCNVVFETVAHKMGMHSLSDWFLRYGLGRPSGVGLRESAGRLYRPTVDNDRSGLLVCSAGIGEQVVLATPIQMANVAATICAGWNLDAPAIGIRRQMWGAQRLQPAPDLGSRSRRSSSVP